MRRSLVAIVAAALVIAVALQPQSVEAQCAMCRRALDSPEGRQMIAALRSGVLVLLIAPFALFASVATLAICSRRKRSVTIERDDLTAIPAQAPRSTSN
jgi:hypothetical protein